MLPLIKCIIEDKEDEFFKILDNNVVFVDYTDKINFSSIDNLITTNINEALIRKYVCIFMQFNIDPFKISYGFTVGIIQNEKLLMEVYNYGYKLSEYKIIQIIRGWYRNKIPNYFVDLIIHDDINVKDMCYSLITTCHLDKCEEIMMHFSKKLTSSEINNLFDEVLARINDGCAKFSKIIQIATIIASYLTYEASYNDSIMKHIINNRFAEPLTSLLLEKGYHFNFIEKPTEIQQNFINKINYYGISMESIILMLEDTI